MIHLSVSVREYEGVYTSSGIVPKGGPYKLSP